MARLGLGADWRCVFANEWDVRKAAAYRAMFGPCPELLVEDVARLEPERIPGRPDLVWASFPCQDLSLAGNGAGLHGARSGTFKPFWRLVRKLAAEGRGPRLAVLENVTGTLTSHGGRDFAYLCGAVEGAGYRFGALVIDAIRFLPQSRPRLFIVAAKQASWPAELAADGPDPLWHPPGLLRAFAQLPARVAGKWVWWRLPEPPPRRMELKHLLEPDPPGGWHPPAETARLLSLMTETQLRKVRAMQAAGGSQVGTVYRRTRPDPVSGARRQRAEVRCDGVAGCLRTPGGGSSRQFLIEVRGASIRTRLLSAREAARLMGVPDAYPAPANANEAYHLFGDGLAVPAVAWLSRHLLSPLARCLAI